MGSVVDPVPCRGHRPTVDPIQAASRAGAEPDVAAWARAARDGDAGAFARLHERYARMIHAIVLARVPAREAEDLVQDVFLKALGSVARLRDAGAFGPWLCRIARNRTVDYHRRKKPVEPLVADVPRDAPPAAEAQEALRAVRALPDTYRETLLMRLVEGMTGPEIAERTGLTPASVRVNLHRGMQLLRERLGAARPKEK